MKTRKGGDDTICAISTPIGMGGIGVIRVSGAGALAVVDPLFKGKGSILTFQTHTAHHGAVFDPALQEVIDEALFLVMRAPRSYTGEDVVEIQAHGNPISLQRILSLLIYQGARLAEPGEFTRRAFLSGRIDLVQAEAVMEMISAQSREGALWALSQLKGGLSEKIEAMRERLLNILAQLEGSIDFSEEGIELCSSDQLSRRIEEVLKEMRGFLADYEKGKRIREGVSAIILGRPNVGKSSLMNLLLEENRAIVTPIPGTTRDLLQEWISLEGLSLKIVDTAGYRKTDDPIEIEGIRRAAEALKNADLALCLLDASAPLEPEDKELLEKTRSFEKIIVLNKSDLPRRIDLGPILERGGDRVIEISALTGEGVQELKETLKRLFSVRPETERPLIALLRHRNALERSEKALDSALTSLLKGLSPEFPAVDLREAVDSLGEIVGETTTDEILDQIFNRFCIGK